MGLRFSLYGLFLFFAASFVGRANAETVSLAPFFYLDDFTLTENEFAGDWKGQKKWNGTICNGGYSYTVAGRGRIEALDMQLRDDGSLDAKADIRNITASLAGSYRSGLTVCQTVSTLLDADADKLIVNAHVLLEEKEGQLSVRVRVLNSHIDRIYFSRWFPEVLETFLTHLVNRAMNYIWTTKLGDWIGDKVGEAMKDSFPGAGRIAVSVSPE